jgi:predicted extracellular nuclease/endonuclease I
MNIKALSTSLLLKISLLTIFLCAFNINVSADVFISEYVEGSSNNKSIEIYNNSANPVDLSQYKLAFYFNGNQTKGNTIQLAGSLPAFSAYVVVDQKSNDALKMKASLLASGSFFNGNDFVQLIKLDPPETDIVIDTIGTYNLDPGSEYKVTVDGVVYSTKDKTLVRRQNIVMGDSDGSNEFDPSAEWDVFATDDFSNLGTHITIDTPADGDSEGNADGGLVNVSNGDLSNVCSNCADLPQFKDPAAFDASVYYTEVNQLVSSNAEPSQIKAKLSDVISTDITRLSYSQVWTAMTATDQDPDNSDNIILLYSGRTISKISNGSGTASANGDNWNREHTWPKSRGFSNADDEPYTDIHHLRPTDISINSARGNLSYDESDRALFDGEITTESDAELRASILSQTAQNFKDNDSFEPRAEVKGDVARMMLYMDTRYEAAGTYTDLVLTNNLADNGGTLGKLCTLLQWNMADPVSDFETNRNDAAYQYQGNRNPFIDNPQWVELLYPIESCDAATGVDSDGGDGGVSDGGSSQDSGGNSTGGTSHSPLIITAIFDGPLRGGTPKGIEVFVAQDISNLTTCSIRGTNNGGTPSGIGFAIEKSMGANSAIKGEFLYFSSEEPGFTAFFGFAPDATTGQLSINGDDVVQLLCDGNVIDTYGVEGVDGSGEVWEYSDGWAYRRADTLASAEFTASNWLISGKDALDGESLNTPTLIPVGTYSLLQGGLIISEYVEGSSFNKAIEIANLTGGEVDLSNYTIQLYSNGAESITKQQTLSGILAANSVFVIANPAASAQIQALADLNSSIIDFNGDDVFVLADAQGSVDVIGQIGVKTEWGTGDASTSNNTIRRKLTVTQGDNDGSDAFDPSIEWDGFEINNIEDLGSYAGFNNGGGDSGGGTGGPSDDELLGFCFENATKIHTVQGDLETSPLIGEKIVVEGVVTLVAPTLGGFFMQEEDADRDANSATSEGVFVAVSVSADGLDIFEGDVMRVLGTVAETFGRTQIEAALISTSCTTDKVSEVELALPLAAEFDLESIENMLVGNTDTWFVTDLASYVRFGELVVSAEVLFTPTHLFAAGSAEAIALVDKNSRNKIIVDDLTNGTPESLDLPIGGFDATNPIRIGDSLTSVTGVIDYDFGNYRIRPVITPILEQTNFRTDAPELKEGNLKVASFNVLNLFNGDGLGNNIASGRGAKTQQEYALQLLKITNAIIAIDADVIGLMEIENDGYNELSSIAQLVDSINTNLGAEVYRFIDAVEPQGTDAISVGILYKPETVTPDGGLKVLNSDNSIKDENNAPLFDTSLNRPSFAQVFILNESDKPFVINVNHFKSKGSSNRCIQPADNDGLQGNCNITRTRAAQALNIWLNEEFIDLPVMIIGDLNAYAKEDPIQTLLSAGFKDVARELEGPFSYSYRFDGQVGSLDYALANEKAFAAIVDVTEWHINADEYAGFDYSSTLPRSSTIKPNEFLSESVYRASDHDPVIVSLLLEADESAFGDLNADGAINFKDYIIIIRAYGSSEGSRRFNPAADIDNSGRVNFRDIVIWYFAYLYSR